MKASTFLIMFGLFLTFGAVGGIETSVDNIELLGATAIAIVGLGVAWCGVLMQRTHTLGYYNKTVDNSTLW